MMNQKGNVLFLILIAVALFAALSYAVTGSSRNNSSTISYDKAKIAAAQAMQYATSIENAINRLRVIVHCTETQLSFERAPFDGSDTLYINSNAPSDKSCHIFHPNGGNVSFSPPPKESLDLSRSTETDYGAWIVTGNTAVNDIGTTCAAAECNELVLFLPHVNNTFCKAINLKNNVNADGLPVTDDSFVGVNSFRSSTTLYRYNANYEIYDSANEKLVGKRSACISSNHNPGAAGTHFYYVLMAR